VKEKSADTKTKIKSTANGTKEKAESTNVNGSAVVKTETKVKATKQ
jgi:hypothetical protein